MKKLISFITVISLIISLPACAFSKDEIINSLGKYEHREFYSEGAVQDYTDYAKYYFTSAKTNGNKYFRQIAEADIEELNKYLDDFERRIEAYKTGDPASKLAAHYDFDRTVIDIGDSFCIRSEESEASSANYQNYDIYFFDSQTGVLYYFHNNT